MRSRRPTHGPPRSPEKMETREDLRDLQRFTGNNKKMTNLKKNDRRKKREKSKPNFNKRLKNSIPQANDMTLQIQIQYCGG